MSSRGVNKVIIVGNLGGDPEVRYMPNGNAVAGFSVATSESWKDKHSGEQREDTEWHKIVIYGRLAEIAGEYLRKGAKVYLEGRLKTRKWQGQDGQDRYTTEIICDQMQMLDSRQAQGNDRGYASPQGYGDHQGSHGGHGGQQGQFGGRQQQNQYGQSKGGGFGGGQRMANNNGNGSQGGHGMGDPGMDFDDDIPF